MSENTNRQRLKDEVHMGRSRQEISMGHGAWMHDGIHEMMWRRVDSSTSESHSSDPCISLCQSAFGEVEPSLSCEGHDHENRSLVR